MVSDPELPGDPRSTRRRLRLRYPAECTVCHVPLSIGLEAFWERSTKQVTCRACGEDESSSFSNSAGASAATEGDRRRDRRVAQLRRRYGDDAAAVAREMAERDVAASWRKGSDGESRLAAFVDREVGERVLTLHDRIIPGTRGNIDHIFVASTGVWVVDAKVYKGRLIKREVGSLWRRDYPGALKKRLKRPGPIPRERMERAARKLDVSLPTYVAASA